jgi:hypothetical protein
MGKLFERLVRTVGSFRTTKTMNKRTGRVTTKVSRVKPKVTGKGVGKGAGKIQKRAGGPRK